MTLGGLVIIIIIIIGVQDYILNTFEFVEFGIIIIIIIHLLLLPHFCFHSFSKTTDSDCPETSCTYYYVQSSSLIEIIMTLN